MEKNGDSRTAISVRPAAALAARRRLFSSLEAALPVSFVPGGSSDACGEIAVFLEDRAPRPEEVAGGGLPTLAIGGAIRPGTTAGAARLGSQEGVDQRVRGLRVPDRDPGFDLGPVEASEEVLAESQSGRPAWTASRGGIPIHRVASPLPELGPAQGLRDLFAEDALAAIALIQFLRSLDGPGAFRPPGLRATILFDDPNLRWRTYGFIDFERLAEHAAVHDYHASMAMIPLDCWGQHRSTVELFRRNPERLSLALHGNNHVGDELARPQDETTAIAIAAQAIRRARRFEARYGLRMDRVMIPPHGMCSASVAHALGALGFDALCAIHPYPWTENPPADQPLAGWEPAEFAGGCAVIPRIPFTTDFTEIAVRAFLNHPLVLYGHHEDVSGGLDLLAETASRVNCLGQVRWLPLAEIAATNFSIREEAGVVRVRPYSHRLRFELPPDAEELAVEAPRNAGGDLTGWSLDDSTALAFGDVSRPATRSAEVRLIPKVGIQPDAVSDPAPRVWPIVRRAATETRDRLRPLIGTSPH